MTATSEHELNLLSQSNITKIIQILTFYLLIVRVSNPLSVLSITVYHPVTLYLYVNTGYSGKIFPLLKLLVMIRIVGLTLRRVLIPKQC